MIKLEITNRYAFSLAYIPYAGGVYPEGTEAMVMIATGESKSICTQTSSEPAFIDVPAMGALFIDPLQHEKIWRYQNDEKMMKLEQGEYVDYRCRTLVRYAGQVYYFLYDDDPLTIGLSLDAVGSVTINHSSADKVVPVKVSAISARYPFD